MKHTLTPILLSSLLASPLSFSAEPQVSPLKLIEKSATVNKKVVAKETIEICFVLDTTGSMGGLIKGAKQKIWSIANEIATRKPTPTIRFSLVGYRDKGDTYITKVFEMTDDLDNIHGELMKFHAGGGGDGPESVNQALHEAVSKVKWSSDKKVKKILFLVGDAPPHMDYDQEIQYPDTCALAIKKGITINSIQCGSMSSCTPIWRDIANLGKGKYIALPQNGGVVHIEAPQDKEIAKLSTEIYQGAIAYGNVKARKNADWKKGNAIKLAKEDVASNAAKNMCQNVSGIGTGSYYKAFSGQNDLVTEWAEKNVDLKSLKREHLPKDMRELNDKQLAEKIESTIKERTELQQKINKLQLERQKFIDAELKKKPVSDASKAFDTQVEKTLKTQLK